MTTSESTHLRQRRVHSARKRLGGRRDITGLLLAPSVRQLENTVIQLRRQLRDERIRFILDLRVAGGLISENERGMAESAARELSDEALELVRGNLIEMLAHFNIPATPAASTIARSPHYIA